jgi:hypothetical protein
MTYAQLKRVWLMFLARKVAVFASASLLLPGVALGFGMGMDGATRSSPVDSTSSGGPSSTAIGVSGNSGQAGYQINIAVPKGTAGSEPSITLSYSSTLSDGPFGVGWQLGFGEVRRTLRYGTPAFDDSKDQFEFNGQLLVADDANPGEYRTITESFAKIVHTISGSDDRWTVNFPDGRIARFGINQESRIRQDQEMNPVDDIAQWLLSEVEDTSGNVTRFVYDRISDPGTAFPKTVEYTYRNGSLVGELRSVEFFLEDRPDFIYGFPGGVETRISKRVREIRSLEGTQIYRRLILDYTSPITSTTGRSRLTSAQVFGTDCPDSYLDPTIVTAEGVCEGLPAKTFSYTDASDVLTTGALHENWINRTAPGGTGGGWWWWRWWRWYRGNGRSREFLASDPRADFLGDRPLVRPRLRCSDSRYQRGWPP